MWSTKDGVAISLDKTVKIWFIELIDIFDVYLEGIEDKAEWLTLKYLLYSYIAQAKKYWDPRFSRIYKHIL